MEGKCSGLPYAFPQQTLRGGIVFTKFGGKETGLINFISSCSLSLGY